MKSRICIFIILLVLFQNSGEKPVDSNSEEEDEEKVVENSTTSQTWIRHVHRHPTDSPQNLTELRRKVYLISNRHPHSRMRDLELTSSTTYSPITEFDYWSYFTTPKRPFFSYKDFPGKPGVASWKEISPVSPKENRESRKMAQSITAGSLRKKPRWWILVASVIIIALIVNFA